jgi:hypothetical protein
VVQVSCGNLIIANAIKTGRAAVERLFLF